MSYWVAMARALGRSLEKPPNKSLHRTFDSLPIFAFAKTSIASNAGELRRYVSPSQKYRVCK